MKIEAIDLFYVALPEITRTADGSQDSLVVRIRTDNGLEGWGECDASPLISMAAYVMPMSHSNVININEALIDMRGSLLPFGWAKLLWKLRRKRWKAGRVPLMGVATKHQHSRLASQLAFMMIEYIRRWGVGTMGTERAEVGWILEDNKRIVAIADAIQGEINRVYTVYRKGL